MSAWPTSWSAARCLFQTVFKAFFNSPSSGGAIIPKCARSFFVWEWC
jgi:hypothetical protein